VNRSGLFPLAALVGVAGFVAGMLLLTDGDSPEAAVSMTTTTRQPVTADPVTSLAPPPATAPLSTIAPPPATAVEPLGGWEDLNAPFGRRRGLAVVWTGTELLIWDGDQGSGGSDPPTGLGYAFDPALGNWRRLARSELCPMGDARGVWTGAEMVVWPGVAAPAADECVTAAGYDPATDSWRSLDALNSDFFRLVGKGTSVVWTGELLVAPSLDIALDPIDGPTLALPPLPRNADDAVFSPRLAHWTGEEILVLGSDELFSWVPGDAQWTELPSPPIADRARTSAWGGAELLAVNYEMEAARWDGTSWTATDPLPLRFYECSPVGLSGDAALAVESCGRLAVWDEARGLFVPVPPPVDLLAHPEWGGGQPFAGGDSIYVIGDGAFRYRLRGDDTGRIELPTAMPIGVHFLDRPGDLELTKAVGPVEDSGSNFEFQTLLATCSVISTFLGTEEPAGEAARAFIISSRTGEVVGATEYDDEAVFTVRLPSRNGSDVIDVSCGDRDTTRQLAQQFWEPEY
jgi:hypothetical protein